MTQSCSRALAALILGWAFATVGCKDGAEPSVPGSLQIVAGDGQTAAAGSSVSIPPSVKLLTTRGKPLGGATVTFSSSTNGVVTPATQVTNNQGIATLTSWTLPTSAGSHQLTVSSTGVSPIVISATALAGAASRLIRQSTERQDGTVGTQVPDPPVAVVTDAFDNPVAGIAVTFGASGNGSLRVSSAVSDANGVARTEAWTLGPRSGEQFVIASLPSSAGTLAVTFTANALAGAAAKLVITTQPSTTNAAGAPLAIQPVVDIQDNFNNRVLVAAAPVTASLVAGSPQTLTGTTTVNAVSGRATFTNLAIDPAGSAQLQFTSAGITDATSPSFNVPVTTQCAGVALRLENILVGQSTRYLTNLAEAPACLDFMLGANGGQQYLVQIENISVNGNSDTGVFPGTAVPQSGFNIAVSTSGLPNGNTLSARPATQLPAGAVHSWDFGAGAIYEVAPPEPPGGARAVLKPRNALIDANTTASAAVGDTIIAFMEGIPRLSIPNGNQRAVVRYVDANLIIAEDVRLATLVRQGGGTNTPLTQADMAAIAADYAQYGKVQADLFFAGRYNGAIEANENKVIAIHSLMFDNNTWAYTYSSGNYFIWDFWVGTNGSTRGPNQQIERNSNNLFMHEIAHMRHAGMSERAGRLPQQRGNRWLVEGFARATERWPIAMRLLGVTDVSRTGNIVLPGYSTPSLNTLEDVPVYILASASMYGGYAASSYLFDYFADQVARTTATPWRTALGEFLVSAGSENDLNLVINRYLPGISFMTLLTRARIALYLDDFANGLPDWTQYHQFQLRASRSTQNPQLDPRNLWNRIVPGTAFSDLRAVPPGGAHGYIVDGSLATANARILFDVPRVSYAALSITRIQ